MKVFFYVVFSLIFLQSSSASEVLQSSSASEAEFKPARSVWDGAKVKSFSSLQEIQSIVNDPKLEADNFSYSPNNFVRNYLESGFFAVTPEVLKLDLQTGQISIALPKAVDENYLQELLQYKVLSSIPAKDGTLLSTFFDQKTQFSLSDCKEFAKVELFLTQEEIEYHKMFNTTYVENKSVDIILKCNQGSFVDFRKSKLGDSVTLGERIDQVRESYLENPTREALLLFYDLFAKGFEPVVKILNKPYYIMLSVKQAVEDGLPDEYDPSIFTKAGTTVFHIRSFYPEDAKDLLKLSKGIDPYVTTELPPPPGYNYPAAKAPEAKELRKVVISGGNLNEIKNVPPFEFSWSASGILN